MMNIRPEFFGAIVPKGSVPCREYYTALADNQMHTAVMLEAQKMRKLAAVLRDAAQDNYLAALEFSTTKGN